VAALLAALLLSSGCGRIGVELLPDIEQAPDASAPNRDAATGNGSPDLDADVADDLDANVADDVDADAADLGADAAGSFDADAANTRDTSEPADAAGDVPDPQDDALDADAADANVAPGTRVLVDNAGSASALSDFPVRFLIDTAAPIAAGQLAPDCSNMRIWGDSGCAAERAFFLPEHGCNSVETEVWVRVPLLSAGGTEVLQVSFAASAGGGSDGSRVFAFFDGFGGSSLDRARWTTLGTGTVSVSGGTLRSLGVTLLESVAAAVNADEHVLGVRIAAAGQPGTDIELGVGRVTNADPNDAWAYDRTWNGLTFVSYTETVYAYGSPSSACSVTGPPPPLGLAWADQSPALPSFQSAEFAYANVAGRTEAWLRTSRGASFQYRAPFGCTLATSLPILLDLDHSAAGAVVEQQLDYVYVRPTVAQEPTASVRSDSSLPCGAL
jgi:hypothetical protein